MKPEMRPRRVTLAEEIGRCEAAFRQVMGWAPQANNPPELQALWKGWQVCWNYLEQHVTKEFIER